MTRLLAIIREELKMAWRDRGFFMGAILGGALGILIAEGIEVIKR